ncbi:MAG: hypothetical protein ABSB35_14430 [Bryobacteraceae bacterium]|jgi:hypothetical protein
MGRYYLYFAHHRGDHIRMAYADHLSGPWKIYDRGVLDVRDTEFYRPQPDPPLSLYKGFDVYNTLYTHVASPEVYIDEEHKRLVMFVHGLYTAGKKWPVEPKEASQWLRDNSFGQYTQTIVSRDGIHFEARPGITAKTSYLRLFRWNGTYYSMSRLGVLGRSDDLLAPFELGPNPFAGGAYAGKVRHVGLLLRGNTLYVFFSAIGDSPERIMLSTIELSGDWRDWKASSAQDVLAPREAFECVDLPPVPSKPGEIEGQERALRDPGLIEENGKVTLFYSYCGEQGIAAADVTTFVPAASRPR